MAGDNVHLFTQFEDFNEIYQITNDTGSKDFIHMLSKICSDPTLTC